MIAHSSTPAACADPLTNPMYPPLWIGFLYGYNER